MKNNTDIPNELYYLDDNFSVRSLRKYQLKEILTAHNIPYLHSITRVDLINLFKKHIEPKREEILREYKQKQLEHKQQEVTEEYGRGHRATHRPVKFEDEAEVMYTPKRRQKTNATESKSHKKDKDGFAIPSLPKREMPTSSFNAEDSFAEDSMTEGEERVVPKPVSRKAVTKKSTSSTKKPTPVSKRTRTKNSPPSFNAEDSFYEEDDEDHSELEKQRVARQKSPMKSNKKDVAMTLNNTEINEDEEENDADYHADGDDSDDEEEEDVGEVDKEELVLLYKEQSVPAETLVLANYPIVTRSQQSTFTNEWKSRLTRIGYVFCALYMMVALIGLGITAYARNKNGYCQNYAVPAVANSSVSSILFSQLPSACIPCPDHGVCMDGELTCDTLYERKAPFYNIGHIFPIGDDCIHNSVLGKYVTKVERKIKKELARLQGEYACAHLLAHPESNEPVPIARISTKTVLADLKTSVDRFVPPDKTDEIVLIALTSVLEDPRVHYWEIDNERFLGTDEVEYSFACQLKRLYYNTPLNIKLYFLSFMSVLSAFIGASRDYRKNLQNKEKIDNLVKATTDELKKQYDNHVKDPQTFTSPAVSVSQLRSSIVDVNDSKTINDWHKVAQRIENHPLIRKSFHEVRGDPVEYWELTA